MKERTSSRLDAWLVGKYPNYSRTYFQDLIEKGAVLVNGKGCKKRAFVSEEDSITVSFISKEAPAFSPEEIPLDILFEDEHLLVVNKPAGMVVHPAPGHLAGTFAQGLAFHCKTLEINPGDTRPGIVHRLDKDTSGVLLAAKNHCVHAKLTHLFSTRSVSKRYLAICIGDPKQQLIEGAIGRHPSHRQKMCVRLEGGREAKSFCRPIAKWGPLSLVQVQPITGRTHQIRVHMAHIGAPILGDGVYGNPKINTQYGAIRQLLHARSLSFTHPITGTLLECVAPMPADFSTFLQEFGITTSLISSF